MSASDEVWQAIHHLSQLFDTSYPSRSRLRALIEDLRRQTPGTRDAIQREAEYVLCSMDELVDLIRIPENNRALPHPSESKK